MDFTQIIYLNDKLLVLTTDKKGYINDNASAAAYSVYQGGGAANFRQAIKQLDKLDSGGAIVEDTSGELLFSRLQAMYPPLDAAGGVAFNEKGDILMIYRRGKWDLPKGKLDQGENIEECALREVSEETGLHTLSLAGKICDTYHIYEQGGERLLKRTAWYRMKGSLADKLKPQKEENILEARWVSPKDVGPLALKSYEAVRQVLRDAGLSW
jgi:8-oxo-dGTP pyrophosphatase MutT (NUDIX family)